MEMKMNNREDVPPGIYLPMTRDEFIECMNFVKKMEDLETKFDEIIREISYDGYCSIFSQYQIEYLKLLERFFLDDYGDSDIEYFCYETEWGKRADTYHITIRDKDTGDETKVYFRDAGDLYDYLIWDLPRRIENLKKEKEDDSDVSG